MGITQRSQKIIRFQLKLAVTWVAAGFVVSGLAADKPAEPTPTPEPEPTVVPRPDDLNVKKPSYSDALLARDWLRLTLLKANDLPGLRVIPEYADQALHKRIDDSFGLPAVMTMKDPAVAPPVWWTPEKEGSKSLELGPTRHFNRPELKVEAPMLRLSAIPFLNGESDYIRTMNEVVRLWTLGRTAEAENLRKKLHSDKKKVPRGSLERTAIAILNGFLDLQLAAAAESPVDYYSPSLGSLWDSLGHTEVKVFMDVKGGNKVDVDLFMSALAEPALFSNSGVYPPKLKQPRIKPRSMDLQLFVRSLALPVVFNIASLAVKSNNWTRVYDASQKFEEIYALLDKNFTSRDDRNLLFTTPSGVAATHPMLMRPQTPHQLQVIMRILRAKAQFLAEDPLFALRETSKVILNSRVHGFKTLGFSLAGDIYNDLGYPNYARRFYAFAEAFADVEWYQQNPYFLLGGAENSFWTADYQIARAAFEKFLLSAGDKTFGPWARLRLAEITQLEKGSDKALPMYEELLRNQPLHPAGLSARRRIFCITAPYTGARARHLEYTELKKFFPQYELAEVEQIRACHINGLVDDASKMSDRSMQSLPQDAALQLEMIEEFRQKFPQSPYLRFFEKRKQALEAALGPYHLAFKECESALSFFKANEKKIAMLKTVSGKFLETLKWTKEEQERLMRCAALFSSVETIQKIQPVVGTGNLASGKNRKSNAAKRKQKDSYESPEQRITRLTLAMTTRPTDKAAADLLSELRRRGRTSLIEDVRELETLQSRTIDDAKFWEKLATLKVMQWDLQQPAEKKPLLNRLMRSEVLSRPELTLQNDEFCHRLLLEASSLSRKEWDAFVVAVPTARWLEIAAEQASPRCSNQIAAEALRTAQALPSTARDKHLLWPWLQARGARAEQEAWLALGQRWAQQGSVSKQELENLFKTLEKEADNPAVKQAAKAWMESQKPSTLW